MIYIICILAILLIIVTSSLIINRRQIKSICRQLAFHKDKESNIMISLDSTDKEWEKLAQELNGILNENRELKKNYMEKEMKLSKTYADLSHDIRTPLTSLGGYFELLNQAQSEEEKQKYTNIINERISSLKDILEQLFTYTKIQDSDFKIEFEKCDLNKILTNSLLSFYEDFGKKDSEPVIDIENFPIYVYANEVWLKRIFQNIIKNSLVHGNGQIKVTSKIEDKKVYASFENPTEDDIDCDMVFDRFYKADKARSQISSGLGLSIVYELVKLTDGEIKAKHENGIFTIRIEYEIIN